MNNDLYARNVAQTFKAATGDVEDAKHPFQIAVCHTSGWASPIIEDATHGPYTHTYLVLADRTFSMEPGGLIERPLGYWGERSVYSSFDTSDPTRQRAIVWYLTTHTDLKYDYVGDVIVGLDDVTPDWLNPAFHLIEHWEDKLRPGHAFCSQFADDCFTFAGYEVIPGRRIDRSVTPNDLARQFAKAVTA